MNNHLNTIGLSTLAASALIAMSSLGYSMATANQANPILGQNDQSIVAAVDNDINANVDIERNALALGPYIQETEGESNQEADVPKPKLELPENPLGKTEPLESGDEVTPAVAPAEQEASPAERPVNNGLPTEQDAIVAQPEASPLQVPQTQAAGRIDQPTQQESLAVEPPVVEPSEDIVQSANAVPQTNNQSNTDSEQIAASGVPQVVTPTTSAPDGQPRRRENATAQAAAVGGNNGCRRNPDGEVRPQRDGGNRPRQNQPPRRPRR